MSFSVSRASITYIVILAFSAFFSTLGFISKSKAAVPTVKDSEFEVSCRAQAKEVATKTYQTCMTENRSAKLEELKKDYQNQIKDLKAKYESEIAKLTGAKAKSNKTAKAKPVKNSKNAKLAEKSTEMAIELKPSENKSDALLSAEMMDATVSEDPKVIPSSPMSDDSVMDIPEPIPSDSSI